MFNIYKKKNRRVMVTVLAILLVIAMVVPMVFSYFV